MRRPRQPLFLARASYRRRRLRDAARLLPVVGVFLLMLPLLWPQGGAGSAVIFVFVVWALLIGFAAVLAHGLDQPETPSAAGDD
ncbi:hypothetical protein [Fuscibacter oryzae]|uniref:Uncharacterized protein n=1 Tax=Fuscibacter oryzae TaxID=2803939 RepID=A0A8J7MPE6_9RHOB|nr:hypothetical protein [Fuscibacter oryzae]MBL4927268.1 hypothetical protein [Fuscibacter oryzae]